MSSTAAYEEVLGRIKPGTAVPVRYVRRSGEVVSTTVTMEEDPRVEIVAVEKTGGTLTDDQATGFHEKVKDRLRDQLKADVPKG